MRSLSVGDMAQAFHLRRDTARIRDDLMRAQQELSTGFASDFGKKLSGDFAPLVAVDRQIAVAEAYKSTTVEAAHFTDAAQVALGRIQDLSTEFGPELLQAHLQGQNLLDRVYAPQAEAAFESAISALNSHSGGRSLFAGAATDGAAVADAQTMLNDIRAQIAAEPTAADVIAAVEAWFGPGGGFETLGYQGSANDLQAFRVADGIEAPMDVRADDAAIREQLKGFALAAVLKDAPLAGDPAGQALVAKRAGEMLVDNQSALSALRAGLGVSQERIENATAQNNGELTALRIARNEIVAIDPYQTATELQNLESQLQTIYTLTARLSNLSLVNFLR